MNDIYRRAAFSTRTARKQERVRIARIAVLCAVGLLALRATHSSFIDKAALLSIGHPARGTLLVAAASSRIPQFPVDSRADINASRVGPRGASVHWRTTIATHDHDEQPPRQRLFVTDARLHLLGSLVIPRNTETHVLTERGAAQVMVQVKSPFSVTEPLSGAGWVLVQMMPEFNEVLALIAPSPTQLSKGAMYYPSSIDRDGDGRFEPTVTEFGWRRVPGGASMLNKRGRDEVVLRWSDDGRRIAASEIATGFDARVWLPHDGEPRRFDPDEPITEALDAIWKEFQAEVFAEEPPPGD